MLQLTPAERTARALKASITRTHAELKTDNGTAMDSNVLTSKMTAQNIGAMPLHQLEWYGNQGFIGWQLAAIISQNWLVDKACAMPAKDAVRHGWDITVNDGTEVDASVFDRLRAIDKRMGIKDTCIEFIKMGRIFGIRHALFLIDDIDYAAPFNPDGIKPGKYRGITQIDPYWMAPMFDQKDAADPTAVHFYDPTWWQVNGKKIHRSHFVIMRNGDEVPDMLKPTYFYGGIPTPQKIFERVYAAERTANEAPLLAMSKRLITLQIDIAQAMSDPNKLTQKMEQWSALMNNFGVKVVGLNEEVSQLDTNLTGLDETIMTQYQLVAAAADVPATKLLGTQPKGFNASGEYETDSYHEYLESIQENELSPLLDRHYLCCARSVLKQDINLQASWHPVDTPTKKEMAEINKINADTDSILSTAGAIDGQDIRDRLIKDKDSGYSGIAPYAPEPDEPLEDDPNVEVEERVE
jgi:hypothetical protein